MVLASPLSLFRGLVEILFDCTLDLFWVQLRHSFVPFWRHYALSDFLLHLLFTLLSEIFFFCVFANTHNKMNQMPGEHAAAAVENAAERQFGPEFQDIHILSNAQVAVVRLTKSVGPSRWNLVGGGHWC